MNNKILSFAFILVTFFSFSSYASAEFEITPDIDTLIPENTLMYFQISNPEEFLISVDKFLSKTGMNEMLGNINLIDFIYMQMETEDSTVFMDYYNLKHPLGFAILPPSNKFSDSEDVEFMIFLPIQSGTDTQDIINNKLKDDELWYTIHMNYLVYFSSKNLKESFPSNNIADLSILDRYSKDSLSMYYDTQGIIETFGFDTNEIIQELKSSMSSESVFALGIIQGYFKLLNQIEMVLSNIKIGRKGITLQGDLLFSKEIEQILSPFKNTQDIKKWSAYLPEEGYFQSIYSLNSKDHKMIMSKIIDDLFSGFKDDPAMLELKQSIEIFYRYMGNGGAYSFDIIPGFNKTENTIDDIPFNFSFSMVTELSDSDGFIDEFKNFYSSQAINNLMNSLYADSGFTVQIIMEELSTDEISPVFRIKYNVEEKRTKSNSIHKEMDPNMKFLNDMEYWYHISDGKMFSYMGSDGIEGLIELLTPDGDEKKWINDAPDNSNLIWEISLTKILNQLKDLPELQISLPVSNTPFHITGFTNIKNGIVHSSTNISSENIRNIFKLFLPE